MTECGIVGGGSQRLAGGLCLRPDASQGPGREHAHVEEFVRQRVDQLRHRWMCCRTDTPERLTRGPSDARNRIGQRVGEVVRRRGSHRTDGRQGLRRVDAGVLVLVRQRLDERADRRTRPSAQRAQRASGIARDELILVAQGPSQRRLNAFRVRREVNQGVDRVAPDEDVLVSKQVDQQWNGRRTNPPDDFKRGRLQVFVLAAEESSQHRQRTLRPFGQGGFGAGPDLRIAVQQAFLPGAHRVRRLSEAVLSENGSSAGVSRRHSSAQMKKRRMDPCRYHTGE